MSSVCTDLILRLFKSELHSVFSSRMSMKLCEMAVHLDHRCLRATWVGQKITRDFVSSSIATTLRLYFCEGWCGCTCVGVSWLKLSGCCEICGGGGGRGRGGGGCGGGGGGGRDRDRGGRLM